MKYFRAAILATALVATTFADQDGAIPFQLGQPARLKGKLESTVTFAVEDSFRGTKELTAVVRVKNSKSSALYWGIKIELLKKDGSACDPTSRSITFMPEPPVSRGKESEVKGRWDLGKFKLTDVGQVLVRYRESKTPLPDNAFSLSH